MIPELSGPTKEHFDKKIIMEATLCNNKLDKAEFQLLQYLMTSTNGSFSALLALCAGKSQVTSELPSLRASNADFEQTMERPVIRDYMTFMWCHCNDIYS